MGYNQHWQQERKIEAAVFRQITADFHRIILALDDFGVPLAGPLGHGIPIITTEQIAFNGVAACGHPHNPEIVLPAAAPDAGGVGASSSAIVGERSWHMLLKRRTCDGNCSFESFTLRRMPKRCFDDGEVLPCGDSCKTGFRPYDLAVQCVLLIAKHYLGEHFLVYTAGSDYVWNDPRQLCYLHLDYPLGEFRVNGQGELVRA